MLRPHVTLRPHMGLLHGVNNPNQLLHMEGTLVPKGNSHHTSASAEGIGAKVGSVPGVSDTPFARFAASTSLPKSGVPQPVDGSQPSRARKPSVPFQRLSPFVTLLKTSPFW